MQANFSNGLPLHFQLGYPWNWKMLNKHCLCQSVSGGDGHLKKWLADMFITEGHIHAVLIEEATRG